jgi:NOL1/NOP2/fmu family ribosome biogenesis protein
LAKEDERHRLFSYLEERFGIDQRLFNNYLLFKKRRSWWMVKNSSPVMAASEIKVSTVGLKAFQQIGNYVKPTTRMIQVFGHEATKGMIELNEGELAELVAGEALAVSGSFEKGYVILSLSEKRILGLGFFIDGKIRSQIPRKEIRQAMIASG